MTGLILPSRFTQQPQQAAQIDWGNPLTRGIDVAFVRLDQPGLVGGAAVAKAGSVALVPGKFGMGWYFGNTTSDMFTTSFWPVLPDGNEYTYLVVTQLTAVGTMGFLVNSDAVTRTCQFRIETTGAATLIGFNTAGSAFTATGAVIPVGQVQAVLARSATGAVSVFQNGVKTANVAVTGTIKASTSSETQIGNRGAQNLKGTIGLLIRWPRALSDAEAIAVTNNPWQVLKAPTRRLWAVASGGGTDTPINPDVGALVLSGYSPTIAQTANQSITAGAGSLAITGYAPSISQPQAIIAGAGSITLTGYAPTVTQGITTTITPGVGSLALTGYAPTIAQTANQAISPTTGALVLTGYAPTLTQTANQGVSPAVGSLVITGYVPTITQASASPSLTPDAGQLVITGYAPSVEQSAPITKVGGDDVPRDDERIEIWERPTSTPKRDQALDTVLREAYAKATGKQAAKVVSPKPAAPIEQPFDYDEDDLEVLLLSL